MGKKNYEEDLRTTENRTWGLENKNKADTQKIMQIYKSTKIEMSRHIMRVDDKRMANIIDWKLVRKKD